MDAELRDALADTGTLRWWRCTLPAPLERRFASVTDASRNRQIRVWLGVCLGVCVVGLGFDAATIPDAWWTALALRLGGAAPLTLAAMWLLARRRQRWLTTLACVVPMAACHLSVLLAFAASARFDAFRSANVLPLGVLWMNVVIPLRLRDTVAFTLVTLLLGEAINRSAAALHDAPLDHADVIGFSTMLVALSVLARFLAERESRNSFLLGLRLHVRAEDLQRSNAKLLEMSNTDPLTGLANRRFFDLALGQAWQSAAATGKPLAVMMLDIDHFKLFNDAAGHLEGDRCLGVVAHTIGAQVRRDLDLAARFGGEEFVVLLPATELAEACEVAERVRVAIAALQLFHPGRPGRGIVSVSIGVAALRVAGGTDTPLRLFAAADEALYAAKSAGRDRVMLAPAPQATAALP